MASNYYFLKLHYDILDDWKVGTLPDSLKWLFIQCLCVAGECQEGGLLPEINQFSYRIRREPGALNSDMARLSANELAELVRLEDGSERWFITNYEKRQEKIPQAQKQRDYRTRQRQKEMDESGPDVIQSLPERYDSVTIRNTDKNRIDKDTDKNKNKSKKPTPIAIPTQLNTPDFIQTWDDFQEHRREIKATLTPRAANMQLKKLAEYSPTVAVKMIEQTIANGWKGIFELKQSNNGNGPQKQEIEIIPLDGGW
jgi:hypothetical protein